MKVAISSRGSTLQKGRQMLPHLPPYQMQITDSAGSISCCTYMVQIVQITNYTQYNTAYKSAYSFHKISEDNRFILW